MSHWRHSTTWHVASSKETCLLDGPSDESQSHDARPSNVLMSYIGIVPRGCRRRSRDEAKFRERAVLLGEDNVLVQLVRWQRVWPDEPRWMLAQASWCAGALVCDGSWSRQLGSSHKRHLFIRTRPSVVSHDYWCANRTRCPQWEHFCLSPTMAFVANSSRVNTLHAAVVGRPRT